MKFANMKFAVKDAAQSEALIKVLLDMGYQLYDNSGMENYTSEPYVYTYTDRDITSGSEKAYLRGHEEMDTGGFIALMTSPHGKPAAKSLDEAWDAPSEPLSPWFENYGKQPVADDSIVVDVMFREGTVLTESTYNWDWRFHTEDSASEIVKWRYNRNEDYFKQPATAGRAEARSEANDFKAPATSIKVDNLSSIGSEPGNVTSEYLSIGPSTGAWKWDGKRFVPVPTEAPASIDFVKTSIARLANYTGNMSYADSYFGEPAGDLKRTLRELDHVVNPESYGKPVKVVVETPRNKYSREIKPGVFCDVYDLLRAFNVTDPCLQHLVKKALAVGQRGHKDAAEDYDDIVKSAIRAQELNKEWSK